MEDCFSGCCYALFPRHSDLIRQLFTSLELFILQFSLGPAICMRNSSPSGRGLRPPFDQLLFLPFFFWRGERFT